MSIKVAWHPWKMRLFKFWRLPYGWMLDLGPIAIYRGGKFGPFYPSHDPTEAEEHRHG